MAGGRVEFPLMAALLAGVQRALFGPSLTAIHVLPAVAGAAVVILIGLMAREMGGGIVAQRIAGLAALVAPAFIGADALFTMDAFDQLWWTLGAYILLRLLSLSSRTLPAGVARDRRRLWLLFGLVCGLGLLTKLTVLAFVIATDFRRADLLQYFRSVRRAAIVPGQDGIRNEEVGRAVWVCRDLTFSWSQVWPRLRNFS